MAPMYEIFELKNKLKVLHIPQKSASATAMILTKTGSRNEMGENNGVSHFLEHLLFKGSKKYKGPKKLNEAFEILGAQHNAYTSKEHTAFYAKSSPKHINEVVEILTDMFVNPTIPPAELEKERGVVIEEINMYEDMPMHTIDEIFEETFFGKHSPLGRTILGTKENIQNIPRKEILRYKNENYDASRTILVLSGDLPKTIIKKASELAKLEIIERKTQKQNLNPSTKVFIKTKKTDQTHFYLGVPTFAYNNEKEHVLVVLSAILGAGMSSRLFMEIREKRSLAYYISSVTETFQDCGYFAVRAGVSNEKLNEAISATVQLLENFKKPTNSELKKAKEQIISSLLFSLDSSDGLASFYGKQLLLKGKIKTPTQIINKIRSVTADEVKNLAKELFLQPKTLAVIGPHKNKQELETIIS